MRTITLGLGIALLGLGIGYVTMPRLRHQAHPSPVYPTNRPMGPQEVNTFDQFPLVWLGDEFEGMRLTAILRDRISAVPDRPEIDRVTFIYGDCTPASTGTADPATGAIPREESCPAPLQVTVSAACSNDDLPGELRKGNLTVRGASADRYGTEHDHGHLMVETSWAKIAIISSANGDSGDQMVVDAASALEGRNGLAQGLSKDKPLTTPLPRGLFCR